MSTYIKNPNRNTPKPMEKYVPEYIRLGKEPSVISNNSNNYVEGEILEPQAFNQKRSPNAEVFASLDDITFDDEEFEPQQFNTIPQFNNIPSKIETTEPTTDHPEVGQYILLVNGDTVCISHSISEIEEKVKKVAYGEDEDFPDKVEMDDIVLLKRVGLKVGIFVEE